MGRAPCCEKMGLKKGPWTPEEDQILINYIRLYGHSNWRALPKQAGLLRCGKSCRLRWINYLRPDIKRGNFTREEEETIIKLHDILGNRWSAIAAELPGRTDNEIKNVWHTHLKKRVNQNNINIANNNNTKDMKNSTFLDIDEIAINKQNKNQELKKEGKEPVGVGVAVTEKPNSSPSQSSSNTDTSTVTIFKNSDNDKNNDMDEVLKRDLELSSEDYSMLMDDKYWREIASIPSLVDNNICDDNKRQIEILLSPSSRVGPINSNYSYLCSQDVDFWCGLLNRTEDISDMLDF